MGRGPCPVHLGRCPEGWICPSPGARLYFLVTNSEQGHSTPHTHGQQPGPRGASPRAAQHPSLTWTFWAPAGAWTAASTRLGRKESSSVASPPLPRKRGFWNPPTLRHIPSPGYHHSSLTCRNRSPGLRGDVWQDLFALQKWKGHLQTGTGCQESCTPSAMGLGGQRMECLFAGSTLRACCHPCAPLHSTPRPSPAPYSPLVEPGDWDAPQG